MNPSPEPILLVKQTQGTNLLYPNSDTIFKSGSQPHPNYYKEKIKLANYFLELLIHID